MQAAEQNVQIEQAKQVLRRAALTAQEQLTESYPAQVVLMAITEQSVVELAKGLQGILMLSKYNGDPESPVTHEKIVASIDRLIDALPAEVRSILAKTKAQSEMIFAAASMAKAFDTLARE